ncbi:EamA family transporter RarD [Celeribacter halophilus]|uniref:Chloramphenicol-sensitive protein RarD n=1 Tax=Celeribacter halophilus TaxID=576117 RepID=A0A1I3TEU8_9RHOB|nr:EamA family transporter RarD [Celeribacter halophilus]PZX11113.1 chloramphenicol-sensitive protein RarD [Celeribacter halophilus]SFJ69013.1 chloramphenicol-sensitive protein RarD [Celeribacter halophilus]
MTETQKGLVALLIVQTSWGLLPLYYKAMDHVPAMEVLAHRTLWTFVLFGLWILLQGRLGELRALLSGARLKKVMPAAFLISINWGVFIYAVQAGQALEAAFGYYIFPLVATLIGLVVFKEPLRGLQYPALALAALAVVVLGVGLGAPPWVALVLALTFSAYGAIKKSLDAGPVISVTAEVAFLAPLALIYLVGAALWGWGGSEEQAAGVFGRDLTDSFLLLLSGAFTGGPLIFFAAAARRLTYTVVGMGQYWNSTLQFLLAVLVFAEPFTHWHAVAMPLIWAALVLYTLEALRQERAARRLRRRSTSSSTVSTVSK